MLSQFIPIEWISALGWTVLHSTWQIAIIAIIVKILMIGLQKKSPQLRYVIGVAALLSICLISAFTFYSVFESNHKETTLVLNQTFTTNIQLILPQEATEISTTFFNQVSSFLENKLSIIVGIWSVGFVLFFLKMFSGFYSIEKLKRKGQSPIGNHFQEKLESLSNRMNIKQSVKLVQSSLVKVPVMLGYFKPIILLPINLTTGMDEKMIEAIIAHELAHIKRNDFMVNIFQTLVESLFYFHPAVWWISNQIREEREQCCDDLAIKACNDSLTYAKSLLHVQTIALNQNGLSLAFTGKNKKHLLNRVKRILNQTQQNSNFMEKVIALSLLIISFIGMSFSFNSDKIDSPESPSSLMVNSAALEMPFAEEESDETVIYKNNNNKEKKVIKTVIDDQVVYAKIENNEVKKLKINGTKISKEDYPKHTQIITKLRSIGQPIPINAMAFPNIPNSPSMVAGNEELILLPPPPPPPSAPMIVALPNPVPTPNTIRVIAQPVSPAVPVLPTIATNLADSTEVMILGDDADVSVIEIIDGDVYINGEKVEGDQKIIINNQNSIDKEAIINEALKGLEEIEMENIVIQKEVMKEALKGLEEIEMESIVIQKEAMKEALRSLEEIEMENIVIQRESMQEAERAAEEARIEHERIREEMIYEQLIERIEQTLLDDGFIKNTNKYSFNLRGDRLKINGKKQPESVLKKYLAIYSSIVGDTLKEDQSYIVKKNS